MKYTDSNLYEEYVINYDLERGFACMKNVYSDKIVFQVSLEERKDKKGFKKEINSIDCGYNEGICADVNLKYTDSETIYIVKAFFFKLARKSGIRII